MDERDARLAQLIVEQLRIERAAKNLTFKELEARSEITEQTIRRYFNELRAIPMTAFLQLARALGADPSVIIARARQRGEDEI